MIRTENLSVGYGKTPLIEDICLRLRPGQVVTLIGPNGSGKSTILKTVIGQLAPIRGMVFLDGRAMGALSPLEIAQKLAVLMTGRVRPELMTCWDVAAMGRCPYTRRLGILSAGDREKVWEALSLVHGEELAPLPFTEISDGQRQRVMLARALCQEPEVIVLDEPTAYLDIRHKIELLDILREMAREKGITVVMSLHEIDLATKISDYLICVKGDAIDRFGPPEEIFAPETIDRLYGIRHGSYNLLFGSVELTRPAGPPEVFVTAGAGYGIPCYRALQKHQIPFATGILFENDVDRQVAGELSEHVVLTPAFEPIGADACRAAEDLLVRTKAVIDAGTPAGALTRPNRDLLDFARARGISVYPGWKEYLRTLS